MAASYPRPWKPTGCGSYRLIRPGVFEMVWRPDGRQGTKRRKRVEWSEAEILAFLGSESKNRTLRSLGLREKVTWQDALDKYRARLEAKGTGEPYQKLAMELLEELYAHANRALEQVQPDDVQAWLDAHAKKLKQKKKRKGWAATANKRLAMVSAFFEKLWRGGKLNANPCYAVERFAETRHLRRVPTCADFAKVWAACEPSIQDLLDWFLITGVRFGEVEKARVDHVMAGYWYIGGRKGKNDHRVHLPPLLLEILLRQPKNDQDGLIFHRWVKPVPTGRTLLHEGAPVNSPWLCDVLKVRCEWAGVQYFTAHCLRHAAASWTDEDTRKIQNLLGHTQIKTTERYIHSMGTKTGAERVQEVLTLMRTTAIQKLSGS